MVKEYYLGLDVHKGSIYAAVLDDRNISANGGKNQDVIFHQEVGTEHVKLIKLIEKIKQTHGEGRVLVAYEAGCLGYTLYRFFKEHGIECRIIAPNQVERPGNKKRLKSDKVDSLLIARMLKQGGWTPIHVLSEEDEATRNFLRCREDVKDRLTREKQRMQKFLLRMGYRYEEGNYWTVKLILLCGCRSYGRMPPLLTTPCALAHI
jgi:transposase